MSAAPLFTPVIFDLTLMIFVLNFVLFTLVIFMKVDNISC